MPARGRRRGSERPELHGGSRSSDRRGAVKVVGWCDALPIDRPTRAHTGVLGLGVVAEFRGRGIGTALLRETLNGARAFGCTRIELGVRAGNARVVPLYERFGFVREGVQRNAIRLDGEYEDLICMALLLETGG